MNMAVEPLMQGQFCIVKDQRTYENAMRYAKELLDKHGEVFWQYRVGKGLRTAAQNASIHLFCERAAEALNGAGFDVVSFFQSLEKAGIPWTKENVKTNLWHPVQSALFETTSTTQLSTRQVDEVYKIILDRVLSERGLYVPFPSR